MRDVDAFVTYMTAKWPKGGQPDRVEPSVPHPGRARGVRSVYAIRSWEALPEREAHAADTPRRILGNRRVWQGTPVADPWVVVAVRALADAEFTGAAFVESQLATIHADPEHPVTPTEVDRRLLLRIAITRGQLPWTHILIDAGLADNGVRLSRGTVLKAVDGHLCLSLQEKAVDDFFDVCGIGHTREPLYPFGEQLNPRTRRRADWLLEDGTFVEMWGMPKDPAYAEKMREKTELAARHRLQLIGLTADDIGRLSEIFAHWAMK